MKKRGVFFTLDAIIALSVILILILVAFPILKINKQETPLTKDILTSLSSIKIGELTDSYIQTLIADGTIKDPEKSVLEQIGIFTITNLDMAKNVAAIALQNLQTNENIGIWFENRLIYSSNTTPYESAKNVETDRQIISGIGGLNDTGIVSGFSARGFLSSSLRTEYYYFGGYVGDGNISARLEYYGNISAAEIELAINNNFAVYINGINSGNYTKSPSDFMPAKYSLSPYLANFQSGINTIELKGNNLHISGGFIKINYISEINYTQQQRYYLPGINGLINLYDGLTIPGQLTNLSLNLHFNSSYFAFVTIGNTTIYNGTSTGETPIIVSDQELSSMLDYNELSDKTTPLRIGLAETIAVGNADIILVTAASRSMNYSIGQDGIEGIRRNCNDPLLYDSTTARISLAQCLDKEFINTILGIQGNRVALVGYFGDQLEGTGGSGPRRGWVNRTDFLTNNSQLLNALIDSYTINSPIPEVTYLLPYGGACISCSINSAFKILKENSNLSRQQFVIIMSDGVPTHKSVSGGDTNYIGRRTGYSTNDNGLPVTTSGCESTTGLSVCTTNSCLAARQNANWSSCRVAGKTGIEGYNPSEDYGTNATVYSIGFGPVSQCQMAQNTLQDIAQCGGGSYYESNNATLLQQIYQTIAQNIIQIAYFQQTVTVSQGNLHTLLYPDSYIEFDYSAQQAPFGLVIGTEKKFTDSSHGTFALPPNSSLIKAIAVSYSGPRWTDTTYINGQTAYKLNNYGNNYVLFGDPYSILLPSNYVSLTSNNTVNLTTATSPSNISAGSAENKIIYTVVKNFSSFTPIAATAEGCTWTIGFESGTNLTTKIPPSYTGASICSYNGLNQISYSTNDALQIAVYNLLKQLDFNSNGKIDIPLEEQALQIDLSQLTGIPYTWYTEVQVRVWR